MLLSTHSRYFVRQKLALRPARGAGAALPFLSPEGELDALGVFRRASGPGGQSYDVKAGDHVRIALVERRGDLAVFLVRRIDEAAAMQTLEHRPTGAVREAERKAEEYPAVSAHVFVETVQNPNGSNEYRCLREEVPNISTTLLQLLFTRILRDRPYDYENARGLVKSTHTVPEFNGVRSETLGSMVRAGGLRYVELVRPASLDGLDEEGVIPHPQRMRITIKPEHRSDMGLVERLASWGRRHDWRDIQVKVSTDGDRSRVVELEREASAAEILFVRSELVETRTVLKPCSETIVEELVAKAREIFDNAAGWGN